MSMQQQIESKLQQAFVPSYLEVINESHMHRVAPGAESHFKVVLVSEQFVGQRPLARHRAVNSVLAAELSDGIHATSFCQGSRIRRDRSGCAAISSSFGSCPRPSSA